MSDRQIHGRLEKRLWKQWLPGTFVVADAPSTWRQSVVAACLWAGSGAALSHWSAAALWGFESVRYPRIEITSTRRLQSSKVLVHYVASWHESDLRSRAGTPVTSVERTLLDCASGGDQSRIGEMLDEACRRSFTSVGRLAGLVEAGWGSGRGGMVTLRRVLEQRGPDAAPPESRLETRLARLIQGSHLPAPVRQHVITEEGRFVARVDFAYPAARIAIEAQSIKHHSGPEDRRRDQARLNALMVLGWIIIQVTWEDIHRRPEATIALIDKALQMRTQERPFLRS